MGCICGLDRKTCADLAVELLRERERESSADLAVELLRERERQREREQRGSRRGATEAALRLY